MLAFYEKIRSNKNYYEKIFYDLPNGWLKMNLAEVLLPMQSIKPNDDFQYIDIAAIDNVKHSIIHPKLVKLENAPSRATRKLDSGDVLFSLVRPYLENIAIIYSGYKKCIASTGFYVCRPRSCIRTEFLYYFLLTPYLINGIMKFIKGDNSPSIKNYVLESIIIGLPPLSEQDKIISKIKTLLAQIN